jgi:hypothetical protein
MDGYNDLNELLKDALAILVEHGQLVMFRAKGWLKPASQLGVRLMRSSSVPGQSYRLQDGWPATKWPPSGLKRWTPLGSATK